METINKNLYDIYNKFYIVPGLPNIPEKIMWDFSKIFYRD